MTITETELKSFADHLGDQVKLLRQERAFAQVRNSNTTHNINNAAWTTAPVAGIVDHMGEGFSVSGNGIACDFDGWVSVDTHIGYTVTGTRVSIMVRHNHFDGTNNTPGAVLGKTGYVRNFSGHNQSSASVSQCIEVSAGDVITLQTQRETTVGTATNMDNGGCMLRIKRWS